MKVTFHIVYLSACIIDFENLFFRLILAHLFEKTMKKIIGIAPLIIALILGTCLSSQAQIVMVQPMPIDGGFGMFYHLRGKAIQKTDNNMVKNSIHSTNDSETNIAQYPDLTQEKEYYIIEYEVKYSICTYNSNRQTNLQSGSYYRKLVSCKQNDETFTKKLN